jgi:TfoX/Sxy family transcriptional regulator of competence genes
MEDFEALAGEVMADPEVERSQMMGHPALKTRGKMFAISFGDDLVVKLGRQTVDAMVAAGDARPFDPGGRGRPMRDWAQVPASEQWVALAEEAKALLLAGGTA